jgi:uncharacterized protein
MKVKELTDKEIMRILKEHKDILREYEVERIGLFGSYVSGEQGENSDIDFLVEFKEPNFDNFMNLASYLEDLFGRKVEILTPVGIESIRIKEIKEEIKRSVIYV